MPLIATLIFDIADVGDITLVPFLRNVLLKDIGSLLGVGTQWSLAVQASILGSG